MQSYKLQKSHIRLRNKAIPKEMTTMHQSGREAHQMHTAVYDFPITVHDELHRCLWGLMKKTPCPVSEKILLLGFWSLDRKIVAVLGDKTLRIHCLKEAWNIVHQVENAISDDTHGTILPNNFLGSILHKYMIFTIPTSQSNQWNNMYLNTHI